MKTHVKVAAAAVAAAGLLTAAGCGSSSPAGSGSVSGSGGGVVKLSVLTGFTGPDGPSYQALVSQFNASHPTIKVTMDIQPWDAIGQKLPAEWATGQGPDLATPNFDPGVIFNYIKTNSVLPLDSSVGAADSQINASAFPPAVTKAFTVNGHLYAVPANLATVALYYNKTMFTAAGITDPPKTSEEFVADVKKLTLGGASPTQYGISLADHQTIEMWPILQWMNGGDIVGPDGCATIDSAASVQALSTWAGMVQNQHVSPVGQTGADADTLFSAKKAAMELNGPWAADGFRKAGIDLGIAPVPAGSSGPVTLASTVPMMVAKNTKHKEQALEFLSWWTGKTAQASFSKGSGYPPARSDVTVSDPNVAVFAQGLPTARLYLAGLPTSSQIDTDIYTPLLGQLTRGADAQKSADAAAKSINQLTGCKS
ncbi:extracellular solute-binding protein family 1 [Catenulispora acidiphila DSM 44928]|uniref:Extracellular solute-binding protein family 1 n=1 Tax=Catenulispora acidiphila (strain DSM 44928 / JCM 14897 / NBRC 102108 / NRRL B-24433 / ID139908) TaxID=479433 RepID=C7QJU6_CATAD|nr:ABC transporter substrate-binding protein [Catenulispora acidiphila]ACU73184.1 extracellular solute-binding protein family 1 [Catenulispora acidiphila DSM 44928]